MKEPAEGLSITVRRKDHVFGIDIHPEWEESLRTNGFEMFAKMYLEPDFSQLLNQADFNDSAAVKP